MGLAVALYSLSFRRVRVTVAAVTTNVLSIYDLSERLRMCFLIAVYRTLRPVCCCSRPGDTAWHNVNGIFRFLFVRVEYPCYVDC